MYYLLFLDYTDTDSRDSSTNRLENVLWNDTSRRIINILFHDRYSRYRTKNCNWWIEFCVPMPEHDTGEYLPRNCDGSNNKNEVSPFKIDLQLENTNKGTSKKYFVTDQSPPNRHRGVNNCITIMNNTCRCVQPQSLHHSITYHTSFENQELKYTHH